MTTARAELVDVNVTRWYHCISRCVRSAFLMKQGASDRKQWIEDRLKLLASAFSIGVGGFAILNNHLHVVLRLDPKPTEDWSPEEVVRRWLVVYPPRNLDFDDKKAVQAWIEHQIGDRQRVEQLRLRLADLSWFMKALKEPLARMANREDGCYGAFWASRFKSIAILDEEALLATSTYVDLNPLAAGVAQTPESSQHTSIRQRVSHVRAQGKLGRLAAARQGSVVASQVAGHMEQDHWLIPIEDRRRKPNANPTTTREGMLESFSLGSYLLLVDYTGRLFRNGKARMGRTVKQVFERLGIDSETWSARLKKLLCSRRLRGNFFANSDDALSKLTKHRGKRTTNLTPQAA